MEWLNRVFCEFVIRTVLNANAGLSGISVDEALGKQERGKADTRGMDLAPEDVIRKAVDDCFAGALLVTEETGEFPEVDACSLAFFSDPLDESALLEKFLKEFPKAVGKSRQDSVGSVIGHPQAKSWWQEKIANRFPVAISGPTISLTCAKDGEIVVSAVVNIMSQIIFVACGEGVYRFDLDVANQTKIDLEMIVQQGERIVFDAGLHVPQDDALRFVCHVGDDLYQENLVSSDVVLGQYEKYLFSDRAAGPARIFFLSSCHDAKHPIAFIMSNGERIGEWIPWLAFAKFARDEKSRRILRVFEVNSDDSVAKGGALMSPPLEGSIFRDDSGSNATSLNIRRLMSSRHLPSHFRSTIIVTGAHSQVARMLSRRGFSEVSLAC